MTMFCTYSVNSPILVKPDLSKKMSGVLPAGPVGRKITKR